jgi:hypothetical protein
MQKLLTTTAVAFFSLTLIGTAQAGKASSGSSGDHPSGKGPSSHASSNSYYKESHHDFKDAHHEFYRDFKNGRFYYGKNNRFWSEYRWWDGHNCYIYWCPECNGWYYWNAFYGCYTPIAVPVIPYLPYG